MTNFVIAYVETKAEGKHVNAKCLFLSRMIFAVRGENPQVLFIQLKRDLQACTFCTAKDTLSLIDFEMPYR